jgi:hypothetical protein
MVFIYRTYSPKLGYPWQVYQPSATITGLITNKQEEKYISGPWPSISALVRCCQTWCDGPGAEKQIMKDDEKGD